MIEGKIQTTEIDLSMDENTTTDQRPEGLARDPQPIEQTHSHDDVR